jgi:hypothetical protein
METFNALILMQFGKIVYANIKNNDTFMRDMIIIDESFIFEK